MKTQQRLAAVWLLGLSICGAGLASLTKARAQRLVAAPEELYRPVVADVSEVDSVNDEVWRAAPFRASRQPATERYGGTLPPGEDVPKLSRPGWILTAVLGGTQQVAVFEEMPGLPDVTYALSVGDEMSGYRVDEIRGDSAVVSAGDSVWAFKMFEPWR